MKYYLIDTDLTVTSHEGDEKIWMGKWPGQAWDSVDLPKGDMVHCDDEGLYRHDAVLVTIEGQRLPLPLIVTGSDGERYATPVHSIEEIEAMITA